MYVTANPTYDGRFTGFPYGLAPMGRPRFSGQRQQKSCGCGGGCGGGCNHKQRLVRVTRRTRSGRVYQTLGLTASPALSEATKAATTALNVVLPGVGTAVGTVVGMLTAHHAAAMQTEATTINGAVPGFLASVQNIMAALNAGQTTPAAAISALQSAQATYYSIVNSIIKKSSPCATSCTSGSAQIYKTGFPGGAGIPTSPNDCNSGSTCNAACAIGCYCIEPTVVGLTAIINAGGGSFQIPSTHGGDAIIGTTPSVTVTYNGAAGSGGVAGLAQSVVGGTSTIFGISTLYWLLGGGLLLFLFLR